MAQGDDRKITVKNVINDVALIEVYPGYIGYCS